MSWGFDMFITAEGIALALTGIYEDRIMRIQLLAHPLKGEIPYFYH